MAYLKIGLGSFIKKNGAAQVTVSVIKNKP